MASPRENNSDGDSESCYDLSPEDEQLLVSIADSLSATTQPCSIIATVDRDNAALLQHRSQTGKISLVGIARTDSIDTFAQGTQPRSIPSAIPAHAVQYPDRRFSLPVTKYPVGSF